MRLAQRWGQRVPEKPVQQRLKPLVNVIRRNFIRFRSVAQQYIKLGSFDLGDSYEIEISWATTNTKNQVLLGDSHTSTYYLNISSSIAWWSNGNAYSFSPGSEKIQDGRVKTLRVISALNSIRMILNGIELQRLNSAAYTPYQGSVDNILFGSSNSNPATFDGYLPGLRIWTGGDRDSGTLTDEWLLDDALDNSNIIRSTTATEGDNVAVNKDDVVLQNSKSLGITASVITSGSTYLVKIPAGLRLSGPSGWTTRNSTGGEFLHTANASGAFTVLNISGSPVVLGDLSVKEITGGTYGIAINLDDTSSTTFEYDDESDKWIGPNELGNGDFETNSGWVVGDQFTYDPIGKKFSCDNAQGVSGTSRALYRVQQRPYRYRVSADIDITSGKFEFYDGYDYNHAIELGSPKFFDVVNQSEPYWYFTLRTDRGTSAQLYRLQMQEILEYA